MEKYYIFECKLDAIPGTHVCLPHGIEEDILNSDPPEERGD